MIIRKSELEQLQQPDSFIWATGIEDTFITAVQPRTGRSLDEYELTDHYSRWREDIALIAELGVPMARYGIPWHRINPAEGQWEWNWCDQTIGRFAEIGVHPIIDLVHYGVPAWIENAFLNPEYPERVAEYSARFAERYRQKIWWYTPFNEPRIAAWYCGKLGWWPPFRRSWAGFLAVMLNICRGIIRTEELVRSVDPDCVMVHVDATDVYKTENAELVADVNHRQHIVFLALDLLTGAFKENHSLWAWAIQNGAAPNDLTWFRENRVTPDLIGLNMYPMFTNKEFIATPRGPRVRMPYASADLVTMLCNAYWQRYKRPVMITETASVGSVRRRINWLDDSVMAVRQLRESGVPVIGYTWWPLFALVAWGYRQGTRPVHRYLLQMGLWDLDEKLERIRTSVVDEYIRVARGGSEAVGRLSSHQEAVASSA